MTNPTFIVRLAIGCLLAAASLPASEFHVGPKGNDANPGTADKPFATLERGCDAVRGAKGATVWLHGGDYPVANSFELTAADSGSVSAPIVYRGVAGETVRLRGGISIRAGNFKPVTDAATLARICPSARGQILQLKLTTLGLKHSGPYPDVFSDTGGLVEVYYRDQRMQIARFPNDGYMTMKHVLENAGGPRDRNWAASTFTDLATNGLGGTFEYRVDFAAEHASWAKVLEHGVWLKGYWRIPWQNEAIRVQSIDTQKRTVTFAKPIPGGIGSKYHRPEGSGKEQYWLMNLLEAVDQPGEWCVDFADNKLYFYPPEKLADGDVVIADNSEPLIKLNGASHVVLRDLIIEQGLGHGIEVRNGSSNLIAGCTIRNVSRYGAVFDGGFGNEIRSSDLYWLGAGGVWLGGGDEKSSPRVPAGHRVINNHIHHFAEIERVYAPGVNSGFTGGGNGGHHPAVGMLVANNLIHDTPHAGVLHGSWDSVFEFNEVLEFCKVSNDMGGFYSYDRIGQHGNQTFRYNYIHSSGEGDAIYFDWAHPGMRVHGNIIALGSTGKRGAGFLYKFRAPNVDSGQTIDCVNNIAINCNSGFELFSPHPARIENNITVNCATPFKWQSLAGTNVVRTNDWFASGKNISYAADPGFVNLAKRDFRLKSDAQVFNDLPGFQPIPVEKIGLFVDEYRKRLPTDEEAGRVGSGSATKSLGTEIGDRPN